MVDRLFVWTTFELQRFERRNCYLYRYCSVFYDTLVKFKVQIVKSNSFSTYKMESYTTAEVCFRTSKIYRESHYGSR